jgi:hypothetical protein
LPYQPSAVQTSSVLAVSPSLSSSPYYCMQWPRWRRGMQDARLRSAAATRAGLRCSAWRNKCHCWFIVMVFGGPFSSAKLGH